MKTSIKILLLVLFSIGAIAGVLVFAKTRVAPPSNLVFVDQYANDLKSSCTSFDNISDFSESRSEYFRLDDKLKRFLQENVIDAKISDEYRKKIDDTYGNNLKSYSFGLLQKSVWPEDQLNEMLSMLSSLKADKLTSGQTAVTEDFLASANKINNIVGEYHDALRLSQNTSFNGVTDASNKIKKAKAYLAADYLRNNAALVKALDALPGRLAQSHFNYVNGLVSTLGNYYNISMDYYKETIVPRVNSAITEYKSTNIYGPNKPSISESEKRGISLIESAMNYYVRKEEL